MLDDPQRKAVSKARQSRLHQFDSGRRPCGGVVPGCNTGSAMKPHAPGADRKATDKPDMKSGLPGTLEEQRRDLRAAMRKHEETLRRLAQ